MVLFLFDLKHWTFFLALKACWRKSETFQIKRGALVVVKEDGSTADFIDMDLKSLEVVFFCFSVIMSIDK